MVAHPLTRAVLWLPAVWGEKTIWGHYSTHDIWKWCGVWPETARECIRVER
jgi:hypothetical protein